MISKNCGPIWRAKKRCGGRGKLRIEKEKIHVMSIVIVSLSPGIVISVWKYGLANIKLKAPSGTRYMYVRKYDADNNFL